MKSSHYVADFSVQYFSISIAKKSYIFRLSKGKGNDINGIANASALVSTRACRRAKRECLEKLVGMFLHRALCYWAAAVKTSPSVSSLLLVCPMCNITTI